MNISAPTLTHTGLEVPAALSCTSERIIQQSNAGIGQWQKLSAVNVCSIDGVFGVIGDDRLTRLPVSAYQIDIDAQGNGLVRIVDCCGFDAFEVVHGVANLELAA